MTHPLIGCGLLIKAGCKIILDDPYAVIIDKKEDTVVLIAPFDPTTNTWNAYPNSKPTKLTATLRFANNAYRIRNKEDLARFYHAAAGWPVIKTWIAAIKRGAYASWPQLDEHLVRNHLPIQEPTVLGHMHARRSGQRST